MKIDDLLAALFPQGCDVTFEGPFMCGAARAGGETIAVIGLRGRAAIGVELALRLASAVLAVVKDHPGRKILLVVDTCGQRMSRRDELLGVNGYLAHLAKTLALARLRGHLILSLVYNESVSAGSLAASLFADRCYALPEAEMSVMNLPAMARVAKIALERLEELSRESPVFAPGVQNYVAMGAVHALWRGDLAAELRAALAEPPDPDLRRVVGEERGGRKHARKVAEHVRRQFA